MRLGFGAKLRDCGWCLYSDCSGTCDRESNPEGDWSVQDTKIVDTRFDGIEAGNGDGERVVEDTIICQVGTEESMLDSRVVIGKYKMCS